ncbi:MAG: thioredoxin family protein [Erysipelotrichaceae bacterium]
MKKILIALFLSVFILVGCKDNSKVSGELRKTTAESIIEKFENKETFVFYFSTSFCHACEDYKPVVKEFMESHNFVFNYIVADEDDQAKVDYLIKKYIPNLEYTPSSYYVKEGKIVNEEVGSLTKEEIAEFVKEYETSLNEK